MKKISLVLKMLIVGYAVLFFNTSCKKNNESLPNASTENTNRIQLADAVHPFSIRNVEAAQKVIASRNANRTTAANSSGNFIIPNTGVYPAYKYFRFNPQNITAAQIQAASQDSGITFMGFPFANMNLYNDQFAFDSTKAEQLKDGNVYGIALANDAVANSLIAGTQATVLDTLVLPSDADTATTFQALRQAGYSVDAQGGIVNNSTLLRTSARSNVSNASSFLNICLFKKPQGTISYQDNDLARNEPVRGMNVWALFLGIPVSTTTDANGNYSVPYRFSFGTIMGSKAKNSRVNIQPFDIHGTVARNVYTILAELLVGSIHIDGWVGACSLSSHNVNYTGHSQVRYWSQLLNAYYFHDQYCQQENISNAPSRMTTWACWTNTAANDYLGRPNFGSFGTPMLGQVNYQAYALTWMNAHGFGGLSSVFLSLALTGFLPDVITQVPQAGEPTYYNARLAENTFHELGHASMFRQVGSAWHLQLSLDEIAEPSNIAANPYGNGNLSDDQRVSLAESWAEYLGTNYAIRRYPNGQMLGTNGTDGFSTFQRMDFLRDNEGYFYGLHWIPFQLFNDFADATAGRAWDNVTGVSIRQMYYAFQPTITTWCGYANNFVSSNSSQFNATNLWSVFTHYNNTTLNNIGCAPVPPTGVQVNVSNPNPSGGYIPSVNFYQGSVNVAYKSFTTASSIMNVPPGTYTVVITQTNNKSFTASITGYGSKTGQTVTFTNVVIPAGGTFQGNISITNN